MSVLIRGMQMPEECRKCPMMDYGTMTGETYCKVNGKALAESFRPIEFDGRPEWCPLVEIKTPHGDLIDRDVLSLRGQLKTIKECEVQIYGGASWGFTGKCIAAIDEAPTIIEAEGVEE